MNTNRTFNYEVPYMQDLMLFVMFVMFMVNKINS